MCIPKTKKIAILEAELKIAQDEFDIVLGDLENSLESMRDKLFPVYVEGVVFSFGNRQRFEKAQREFTEALINFNVLWTHTITSARYNVTALQNRLRYEREKEREVITK